MKITPEADGKHYDYTLIIVRQDFVHFNIEDLDKVVKWKNIVGGNYIICVNKGLNWQTVTIEELMWL